jgi:hypothetical protein
MKLYKVTYVNDISTGTRGYKLFETRTEAIQWCKEHLSINQNYENKISEVNTKIV